MVYNLKKITIPNIYLKLRFELQKKYFHLSFKTNKPKIFLFGIPEHNNMGDQAILFAELKFFKDYFDEYEVICIPDAQSNPAAKKICRNLKDNDIIFFHGGGNMGDVWEGAETRRFQVLNNLKGAKCAKIIFPMSTSYSPDIGVKGSLPNAKNYYIGEEKVILSARESLSYEFMKNNFNTEVYFVPDIVLSLDQRRDANEKPTNIVTMLRSDKEKGSSTDLIKSLLGNISGKYEIKNSDTMAEYKFPITDKNRNKLLESKWDEFRNAKLIITDRLHGLIFSVITGTPVIIFDNNNHKVKFTYNDWLKKMESTVYAEDLNLEDILKAVDKLMSEDKNYATYENKYLYKEYAEYIRKTISE